LGGIVALRQIEMRHDIAVATRKLTRCGSALLTVDIRPRTVSSDNRALLGVSVF
jgi:hypothetical protein